MSHQGQTLETEATSCFYGTTSGPVTTFTKCGAYDGIITRVTELQRHNPAPALFIAMWGKSQGLLPFSESGLC